MSEPTLENGAQRLERLERQNRRFKLTGILVILTISSVALMGQSRHFYDGAAMLRFQDGA